MKNLIRAELFKLRKSTSYRILWITDLLIETAIHINNISNSVAYPKYNPTYTGAGWLHNLHQMQLLWAVVVFFFIAFYVNGDFVKHTFYTCLLSGTSRTNAFLAKLISAFVGTVPLMLIPLLTGTLLWSIHAVFGMDFGAKAIFLIAKAFALQLLASLVLISNAVFFSVIAKSSTRTFGWSFGTLYLLGVLRGNIGHIIQIPALREVLLFLLSLPYLNPWTFLTAIVLKLILARYIFERYDLL